MPTKRVNFGNFNSRLHLAGGREQGPPGALRRAKGVAPEITNSVLSRWGSQQLYNINAIQLYFWNGDRYQYDGTALYKNGVSIKTGFDGTYLVFNSYPPQAGLQDYLFILGGGVTPFKIAPDGTIQNWGIQPPSNSMVARNRSSITFSIEPFFNVSADYTAVGCILADEGTIVVQGLGSMKINPSAAWSATRPIASQLGTAQNYRYLVNFGTFISLPSDVFQFWFYFDAYGTGTNTPGTWLEFDVDVHDGSFKKDWYSIAIGLQPATSANPRVKHNVNLLYTFQVGQWQQATIAKSQFIRNGTSLQFDWGDVQSIRFKGGNFTGNLYLDDLTLKGGVALGAGPAVGNGGSEYDYYAVFRNLTTGSQSNPQSIASKVGDVEVNAVNLTNIPISTDPQVTARDLYRTQALVDQPGAGLAFLLDTIYDNTTTTYLDGVADSSQRLVTTPWLPSTAVPPVPTTPESGLIKYLIDGGNGFWFILAFGGTTGAAPPQWNVPTTTWSPIAAYNVGDTVANVQPFGDQVNLLNTPHIWKVITAGKSGISQPNWTAHFTGSVTDGTVVWLDQGEANTIDNNVTWTFGGINSPQVLSLDQALQFDNAAPEATYGWASDQDKNNVVYFTGDTSPGDQGRVFASAPGRPESVAQSYLMMPSSGNGDKTQAVVIWDGSPWLFTQLTAGQIVGDFPALRYEPMDDVGGTKVPHTIVPIQKVGIVYWSHDGIRVLNWSGQNLIGFTALSPIFRGQNEENVLAWSESGITPIFAAVVRDEVFFSDGQQLTLAITYDGIAGGQFVWRQPGPVMTAIGDDSDGYVVSFGGVVYLWEDPGFFTDGTNPIAFEVQSPGDLPDLGAQFTTQRIYLSANLAGQVLTPVAIVDGTEKTLANLTGPNARQTYELPVKLCGRLFDGLRLSGNLIQRIEIFQVAADLAFGE